VSQIRWEPTEIALKDGTVVAAEAGTLAVREDRTVPEGSGERITLRMVKLAARRPVGPPTIFLAGGPGDSGIQWASHPPFYRAFDRIRESTDLILLDQRGSGTSDRDLKLPMPSAWPADGLTNAGAMRNAVVDHAAKAASAWRDRGVPLQAYTVEDSAEDLRDLIDALGMDRANLWGYSYGTHLAQAAVRRMPDRVQRVGMCGFEGPNQTFKLPSQLEAQGRRLDAWAATQGFPELWNRLRAVLDRLDAMPVAVPLTLGGTEGTWPVGGDALRQIVAHWSSVSNRLIWIPRLVHSLEQGRTDRLAEALTLWLKGLRRPLTFYLKDGASGATPERWAQIRAEASQALLGDAINEPFPAVAAALGVRDLGDSFRQSLISPLPFFILTGGFDGFTPGSNVVESQAWLPNARHRAVRGAAHNDLLACPQAVAAMADFLGDGREPDDESWSVALPKMADADV